MDFTSALYLGLRHESATLAGWSALTTGVPAVLREPPGAGPLAARLAALVGCARAVLLSSTLHLFWDLFGQLAEETSWICWDAGSYPVARWGMERAAGRGVRTRPFAHLDAGALAAALARPPAGGRRRPVVLTDGFCPGCGRHAPLRDYLRVMAPFGGTLIIDDTQALGVFGAQAGPAHPFGRGGGGSLARAGIEGRPDLLVGASLAKGFGAPLAFLAGGAPAIETFADRSETRTHCSPPAAAAVAAAARALALNAAVGDGLRCRLGRSVTALRAGFAAGGLEAGGGRSPVQRLALGTGSVAAAIALHAQLARRGVRAVLQRSRCGPDVTVTFLLTARHEPWQITAAIAAVREVTGGPSFSDETPAHEPCS